MNKVSLIKYIGHDYKKYNCFDLVKEFYFDHYDIDIKHYWEGEQVPGRKEVESLIVSTKGDFVVVAEPEYGDIVVIKFHNIECHIGVCIGNGKFLHSASGIGSNMDSLSRYKNMIAGYYRHRERQHDST